MKFRKYCSKCGKVLSDTSNPICDKCGRETEPVLYIDTKINDNDYTFESRRMLEIVGVIAILLAIVGFISLMDYEPNTMNNKKFALSAFLVFPTVIVYGVGSILKKPWAINQITYIVPLVFLEIIALSGGTLWGGLAAYGISVVVMRKFLSSLKKTDGREFKPHFKQKAGKKENEVEAKASRSSSWRCNNCGSMNYGDEMCFECGMGKD